MLVFVHSTMHLIVSCFALQNSMLVDPTPA
jgi:hypothetical protein